MKYLFLAVITAILSITTTALGAQGEGVGLVAGVYLQDNAYKSNYNYGWGMSLFHERTQGKFAAYFSLGYIAYRDVLWNSGTGEYNTKHNSVPCRFGIQYIPLSNKKLTPYITFEVGANYNMFETIETSSAWRIESNDLCAAAGPGAGIRLALKRE